MHRRLTSTISNKGCGKKYGIWAKENDNVNKMATRGFELKPSVSQSEILTSGPLRCIHLPWQHLLLLFVNNLFCLTWQRQSINDLFYEFKTCIIWFIVTIIHSHFWFWELEMCAIMSNTRYATLLRVRENSTVYFYSPWLIVHDFMLQEWHIVPYQLLDCPI